MPWARQRTAMISAERLEAMLADPDYAEEYRQWQESMAGVDRADWAEHRLLPDPDRAGVYATHSTHKSLSALRQASMIVRDQDFQALSCDAFSEAFLTHTSIAAQPATPGIPGPRPPAGRYRRLRHGPGRLQHGSGVPAQVRKDRLISKWFRILDEADLVPDEFRSGAVRSYRQVRLGALAEWNEAGGRTSSCSTRPGSPCSSVRPG